MLDEVAGDELEPFGRADDRLELRPLRLQPATTLFVLALEHLLHLFVDARELVVGEVERREAALVVDGDGGPVLDGLLYVVDVDVVAEHIAGVAVVE